MNRNESSWTVFFLKVFAFAVAFYFVLQYFKAQPGVIDENGLVINATRRAQIAKVKEFASSSDFVIEIPIRLTYNAKGGGFTVTSVADVLVTAYNNLPEQTNDQPNIGASMRKVYEGSIALSKDLLDKYKVRYGDVACLTAKGECYIIEDTMNQRFTNRADIFMYSKDDAKTVKFKTDVMLIKQL